MFKHIINTAAALLTAAIFFTGCGVNTSGSSKDKLTVVTTVFPVYDWTKQLSGNSESTELILLADNGTDMHSFQPTAEDIMQISSCDLFIYIGGESDKWTEDILKNAANTDMTVLKLLDVPEIAVKTEEHTEGMQETKHEEDEEHEEYDEHIWLSPKNAKLACTEIAEKLSAINPSDSSTYSENLTAYTQKLDKLDSDYSSAVSESETRTLLFADRFPFRYMTDDYGLDYYAAFDGCSSETEASFETVAFLADRINELDLPSVMITESSDGKLAQTVISATEEKNMQIFTLNSMQSVSPADIKNGTSYLSVMEDNLETLKSALALK